jgi:hypothetical protein
MQGAVIDESNTSNFGNITDMGNTGNYEFTEICEILSPTQVLVKHIQRAYSPSSKVQLIRIPVYQNAEIPDTLRAASWNGSTGGVLAFECSGTLVMNAPINLDGVGFRGGQTTTSSYECVWFFNNRSYYYPISGDEGAKKGEGVARFINGKTGGRGAQGNGGGGGNDHNSGGGGNGAAGGLGGDRIRASAFTCNSVAPGVGGKPIAYNNSINKIFLGGGGGAGYENNPGTGTDGSNGGGIIIIKADSVISNNHSIQANGASTNQNAYDGAGGGGAGGTILLDVSHYDGSSIVEAKGGHGGNVDNLSQGNCNGTGGGGSGGTIWFAQPNSPTGVTTNIDSGSSGRTLNTSQSNCTVNGTNGATNGKAGMVLLDLDLPQTLSIPLTRNTTTICNADSVFLQKEWRFSTGVFYDTLASGCRDSIVETTLHVLQAKVGTFETSLCRGQRITINGTAYNTSIVGGTEIFKNVGSQNCDSILTFTITLNEVDTSISNNGPTLSSNAINATYQWINCRNNNPIIGATEKNYVAQMIGTYAVIVTQNGCTDTSDCYIISGDNLNPEIKIYPNPTDGQFTIDLGQIQRTTTVAITDLLGREIQTNTFKDSQILDVDFFGSSALYLVTILTLNDKTTFKLVKQ